MTQRDGCLGQGSLHLILPLALTDFHLVIQPARSLLKKSPNPVREMLGRSGKIVNKLWGSLEFLTSLNIKEVCVSE